MAYNSPGPNLRNYSVRKLRPQRNDRLCFYRELFLRKLRSRFRFKEFSYEANYKFFKLAYEAGTSAVYLPSINLDKINKYDALLVFNYQITNGVKTKNNLPLTIKPTPEEIKNSGGLLPNEELEIGKDVVLFWTHSTNHITDAAIIEKIYAKKLVDIDEVKDNIVTSSQTPIIISYRNKDNRNVNNLIDSVVDNNMVGYISDQEVGNIKPFQLSFDAHNYMTALQSEKTSLTDEALSAFGFTNLGRGETAKKERLLTDEVKVESDATNEALFDYIHQLEEFAKRFEDCFKLKLTPLISINGAFVDLETGHKYYKIKGAGGSAEQLGEILNSYNEFSGNTVDFGRSANTFTQQSNEDLNNSYGPDAEERQDNINWLNSIDLGNYTYIPYQINGPSYTQSFFGNIWNIIMSGFGLYRSNDNEQTMQLSNVESSNDHFIFHNPETVNKPTIVNPSLPFFYRLTNYISRRNFNTLDNQYEHLFDIDENKPIQKQDLLNNLNNAFSEKSQDYIKMIRYYFSLIQAYLKAGLSLSLPTLLIASIMATSYYYHMASNSFEDIMNNYIKNINDSLPKNKSWLDLYKENYSDLTSSSYSAKQNVVNILLSPIILPYNILKATGKATMFNNIFPNLLNAKWVLNIGKYLILFLIRNIIYVFAYRVSYGLLDFFNKDGSSIAKHYITTFNAALVTGFMSDQKDYRTGLKYALSTTLAHHLQTILYFANKFDRVEKNKIIRLLNKWNDNILFLFPKDLMAYFISSLIVDNIINIILDPKEGPIKKASKFFINVLSKTTKFSYDVFKNIFNNLFYDPIKNKYNNFSLDKTADYLDKHFDFILNFLQDTTLKFYDSLKDYLMMAKHPLMFLNKIKDENKEILALSDDNIINQNPIDIAKEQKEIQEEAKPIIKSFVNNLVRGQPYEKAAEQALKNINLEEPKEEIIKSLVPKIKNFENLQNQDFQQEYEKESNKLDDYASKNIFSKALLSTQKRYELLLKVLNVKILDKSASKNIIKSLYNQFAESLKIMGDNISLATKVGKEKFETYKKLNEEILLKITKLGVFS